MCVEGDKMEEKASESSGDFWNRLGIPGGLGTGSLRGFRVALCSWSWSSLSSSRG